MTKEEKKTGLELLREPFSKEHIGSLPKPTKKQTAEVKQDYKSGIRCEICGGWHHPKVVHLDYVGHAALTNRLLDCDINWYWEPMAFNEMGLPSFDNGGGLWIRLFVAGHSRIGYGNAELSQYKDVGSREKEVIGDALRNAAMRFGAALDLWHKGDLHPDEDNNDQDTDKIKKEPSKESQSKWTGPLNKTTLKKQIHEICIRINQCTEKDSVDHINQIMIDDKEAIKQAYHDVRELYDSVNDDAKKAKERVKNANIFPGDIPGDGDPFGLPPVDEQTT